MNPAYNSVNFYNILGVPSDATLEDIKKARNRCALKQHTDKEGGDLEKMKAINEAFRVLSNPTLRREFDLQKEEDDDFETAERAGFLPVGRKLSDEYLAKMDFWKLQGMQAATVPFQNINQQEQSQHGFPEKPSTTTYERFSGCQPPNLRSTEEWGWWQGKIDHIEQLLEVALPQHLNFNFKCLDLLDKKIWLSERWSEQACLPSAKAAFKTDYKAEIFFVARWMFESTYNIPYPDVRALKMALYAHYQETQGSYFFTSKRHPIGQAVDLCPQSLRNDLGYIPTHTVTKSAPLLDTKAMSCYSCQESFSIWHWRFNCLMCGQASCSGCLQFRSHPDYLEPVSVCYACAPTILHTTYKADWTRPLDSSWIRQVIKPAYVALLDEMGYASKAQFLQWAEQFCNEGNDKLAIQCTFSGTGGKFSPAQSLLRKKDWMALAKAILPEGDWLRRLKKLVPQAEDWQALESTLQPSWDVMARAEALLPKGDWFVLAKRFLVKDKPSQAELCLRTMSLSQRQWQQLGDLVAASEPEMALLCFLQAKLSEKHLAKKALKHSGKAIAPLCLLALLEKERKKLRGALYFYSEQEPDPRILYSFCQTAIDQNKTDIAIVAAVLGQFSQKEWQNLINQIDLRSAETCMHVMDTQFSCDWTKFKFRPDIDHLRLQFIKENDVEELLNHFLESLQTQGTVCIPFFRQKLEGVNFIYYRDQFLAKGAYNQALICHRLHPNRITWEELAKKWQSKDENASLAALLCSPEDPSVIASRLYTAGDVSLALRCYLQAGDLAAVRNKATSADYQTRLLYQLALYRQSPADRHALFALLSTMLSEKANEPIVQDLLKAALKGSDFFEETLPFHRLLVKTGMKDKELLGLLSFTSKLKLKPENEAWYSATLATFQAGFSSKLQQALYHISLKEVFVLVDLFDELTLKPIHNLLEKLKVDQMERSSYKAVCLVARAMSHLFTSDPNRCLAAMNDITEAMLCDSSSENLEFYAKALEKISTYTETVAQTNKPWQMRGKQMTNLQTSATSEFKDRLTRTPDLKMLLRAEEAIAKLSPLQAALSSIDLSMGVPFSVGMIGSFLKAALFLSQALKDDIYQNKSKNTFYSRQSTNQMYAYRRAIVELVQIAYTLGNAHFCPPTQLYVMRSSIAILTSAFESCQQISQEEQVLLEAFSEEADKLSKVAPFMLTRLVSIYDLLYLDLVNRELMSVYLNRMRQTSGKPVYQYYLLEGAWKGWLDEEKFNFEELRQDTMQALLTEKGQSIAQVERLMSWPVIPRNNQGWLPNKATPLNLSSNAFSSVKGIRFNKETGEISLLLETTDNPMEALFDMNDVSEIMQRGISGAQFTLDPPSQEMPYHPFQEMLYAPKALQDTGYLATMLHADLLMKWLSTGTETSSQAPFAIRDGDHLLARLPHYLQKKFKKLTHKRPAVTDRVHRFWIEAEELFYEQSETDTETTFTFGPCHMRVNKKLMQRKLDGKLVDDEQDTETDSTEAKFAKLMTKEYNNLGKYFPVFARLQELAKLQTMSRVAQGMYADAKRRSDELNIPYTKIVSKLDEIRSQFTYPQTASVSERVEKTLRQNRVSRSQVPTWQLQQLERDIRKQCEEADQKNKADLVTLLQKIYHTNREDTLYYTSQWLLDHNAKSDLVWHLKSSAESYCQQQILRVCQTMEKSGIASELSDEFVGSACTWVPATFNKKDRSRVYGGVNMQPNLVNGRGPGGGGNAPPNRGGPIYRFEHVVRLDAGGRIHGTTTCVDPISGNTYREQHRMEGCVSDQWNQQLYKMKAFWKSTINPQIHHYSHHNTADTAHIYRTANKGTCVDAHGNRTEFNKKSGTHRCNRYDK